MKPARIVVLVVAAGAFAALLAGRSDAAPQPAPQVAQTETTDLLSAGSDIDADFKAIGTDDDNSTGRRINMIRYGASATTISK